MRVQPSAVDSSKKQDVFARRRSPQPTIIIAINSLLIGACLVLLVVSQLLRSQYNVYVGNESIAEAAALLDFMDDLIAVYLLCGSLLLFSLVGSLNFWVWKKSQSRLLRIGSFLLLLLVIVLIAAVWVLGVSTDSGALMPF